MLRPSRKKNNCTFRSWVQLCLNHSILFKIIPTSFARGPHHLCQEMPPLTHHAFLVIVAWLSHLTLLLADRSVETQGLASETNAPSILDHPSWSCNPKCKRKHIMTHIIVNTMEETPNWSATYIQFTSLPRIRTLRLTFGEGFYERISVNVVGWGGFL